MSVLFALPAVHVALLTPATPPITIPEISDRKQSYEIAVITYGYHSAIVLEQPAGWRLGPPGHESDRYLEYGMGDREFYGRDDQSIPAMLAATFWGTPSVILVGGRDEMPKTQPGGLSSYHRTVSPDELTRLFRALERSILRRNDGGRAAPLPPRTGVDGRFYPGRPYYIFWADCNRWTVEQLHAAGLAKSGTGVLVNTQIKGRLRGFTVR